MSRIPTILGVGSNLRNVGEIQSEIQIPRPIVVPVLLNEPLEHGKEVQLTMLSLGLHWQSRTVDGRNPAPHYLRVLYIPGGAGFLPSVVKDQRGVKLG